MIYCPVFLVKSGRTDRQTDRRTESDAYEPTVQSAQVGSKTKKRNSCPFLVSRPRMIYNQNDITVKECLSAQLPFREYEACNRQLNEAT